MTSLPISFVVAFLLLLVTFSNHGKMNESASGKVFALILYLYCISLVLIGIRWTWDVVAVLPLVATMAILTSALLYLAFCSLGRTGPVIVMARDWVHLIPITLVALNVVFLPVWVDVSLIAAKLLYVVLLVKLTRDSSASLQLVRIGWMNNARHALWGAVVFLLVSITIDIAIAVDFARFEGRHAAGLVGLVNLVILLLLGWVSVSAGSVRVSDQNTIGTRHQTNMVDDSQDRVFAIVGESASSPAAQQAIREENPGNTDGDSQLLEKLDRLLVEDRLFEDTELNLQKLARKSGIPARLVSRAINGQTGQNMSQWVNNARIDAACDMLENAGTSISEAMLQSGFLTKSNFNREFKRRKGCSPSEWRSTRANQ